MVSVAVSDPEEVANPVSGLLVIVDEEMVVADCVPLTSPASELVKFVAVVALPSSVPVMLPAWKLPLASRLIKVPAVLLLVAAFARLLALEISAAVAPPTLATTVVD